MTATTITKTPVKINEEQQLYVIPCSGGFTCLGFLVCRKRIDKLKAWITERDPKAEIPKPTLLGSLREYGRYEALLDIAREICEQRRIRCDIELTPQLIGLEGKQVEVVDSSGEPRRFYVGKSMGWMPCHLEIARRDSTEGCAMMDEVFQSVRVIPKRR